MKLKKYILALALAGASVNANAAITFGGYTFADNAFADALYYSSGSYTTSGGSLATVRQTKILGRMHIRLTPVQTYC